MQVYRMIDADAHVFEPTGMWQKYLEPAFKRHAPSSAMKVGNEAIYAKFSPSLREEALKILRETHPLSLLAGFDAESQVRFNQKMGIEMAFLYPTIGLWLFAIDSMPAALAGAFIRAYNNWLYDFCSYDPQILRGVGAINLHAPEEMVSELHRIVTFGWRAVFIRPNPVKGRLLSDAAYEPFWSECERLGIAVGIHEGTHSRLPTVGGDRFHTRFALHACSHPMEQMLAILTLIEGGVLERHPKLRVAFLEGGCSWLPYWLWRLDEEYKNLAWEVADQVKIKPSEYFRRQCYISVDPDEPCIEQVIECIGADHLLFGSDYPHMDYKPDIVATAIALEERLSPKTVQRLFWDNPVRFYGLN